MKSEQAPSVAREARAARSALAFLLGIAVAAITLASLEDLHYGTLRSDPGGGLAFPALLPIFGILGGPLIGAAALGLLIWGTTTPRAGSGLRCLGWALAIVVCTVVFPLYLNPALIGGTGTQWPRYWALTTGLVWAISSVLATGTSFGAKVGAGATLLLGIVWPWLFWLGFLAVLIVRGDPLFEF